MEYIDFLEPLVIFKLSKLPKSTYPKNSLDLTIQDSNKNNLLMISIIIKNLIKYPKDIRVKEAIVQKLLDLNLVKSKSEIDRIKVKPDEIFNKLSIDYIIKDLIPLFEPNYLNDNNENALMISAKYCFNELFDLLIQHTNIYQLNKNGKSVLDIIINCPSKEYLLFKPKTYGYSIKYTMIMTLHNKILKTITDLIKVENKQFLIQLIHTYVNENLIDELVEIIKEVELNLGYSLNVNVKNIIANYQNSIPRPLSKNTFMYPRSGRPVTKMSKLINRNSLSNLPIVNSSKIFNNFHIDPSCFCLDVDTGIYHDVYIPVLRYGKSASHGYYGTLTGQQYTDANFTWYYIEPDSDVYLHGGNVLVSRNKLQTILTLERLCYDKFGDSDAPYIDDKIEDTMFESIGEYLDELKYELDSDDMDKFNDEFTPYDIDKDDYFIKLYRVNLFMENKEKTIFKSRFTNFFRTTDIPNEIYFSGGLLDYLDEPIDTLSKKLGIDIIILTHQSGNSGRLVSELLDTRKRSISFSNLYLKN